MKRLMMASLLLISTHSAAMEQDKQLHLGVSTVIGGVTQYYTEDWKTSLTVCLGVGTIKEVIDYKGYGLFSGEDLAFDFMGCSLGVALGANLRIYQEQNTTFLEYTIPF